MGLGFAWTRTAVDLLGLNFVKPHMVVGFDLDFETAYMVGGLLQLGCV